MSGISNIPSDASERIQDLEYLYASIVNVSNFVSVKLSSDRNYHLWKTQMLCLMRSHKMGGIVDDTFVRPGALSMEMIDQYDCLLKGIFLLAWMGWNADIKGRGLVSYRLALPPQLSHVHDVFHVSLLRGYHYHPLHVASYPFDQIQPDMSLSEEPESILDRQERVMRNKVIPFVKILWKNHPEREATWETEESMRAIVGFHSSEGFGSWLDLVLDRVRISSGPRLFFSCSFTLGLRNLGELGGLLFKLLVGCVWNFPRGSGWPGLSWTRCMGGTLRRLRLLTCEDWVKFIKGWWIGEAFTPMGFHVWIEMVLLKVLKCRLAFPVLLGHSFAEEEMEWD
ncbi:putative nucleotidyltransferase, ribonuclease H [Tanacetum coccineum]